MQYLTNSEQVRSGRKAKVDTKKIVPVLKHKMNLTRLA